MDENITLKFNDEMKNIFDSLNDLQEEKLSIVRERIDFILDYKIKDTKEIEHTLDNLLDLAYWYAEDIKSDIFKLINYYKNIDEEAANDYNQYYLDILKEKELDKELY